MQKPKYLKLQFENLTAAHAPLLKVYYWECCGIEDLNKKLKGNDPLVEHSISLPSRQINSKPLKIVFWIRNYSREVVKMHIKRIKNCTCEPIETRVGFNQFRKIYHCPHRQLMHIRQEYLQLQPEDLVAFSVISYYFLFGEHKLSYEIHVSDSRIIRLHFYLDIIVFNPQKCVLTRELLPVELKSFDRYVQPIWVLNITMQQLKFHFSSGARGLKLVNPDLSVPRQSIWPLMVMYRPDDTENQVDLILNYEGLRSKLHIQSRGSMYSQFVEPVVPLQDYYCEDYPHVLYPNKLEMTLEMDEERTQMVSIHNFEQKCREFRWQPYLIFDCFSVNFEPQVFRLKPHHSTLCIVKVRSVNHPIHFTRTPLVLEVHRIFDKSTTIAKELLDEIESIDDQKWREDSYVQHIYLQLNLRVNFKKEPIVDITPQSTTSESMAKIPSKLMSLMPDKPKNTIFEQLFWEYLQETSPTFMREDDAYCDDLNCEQVLELHKVKPKKEKERNEEKAEDDVDKVQCVKVIEELLAEGLRDMAKNWKFIPREYAEQIV